MLTCDTTFWTAAAATPTHVTDPLCRSLVELLFEQNFSFNFLGPENCWCAAAAACWVMTLIIIVEREQTDAAAAIGGWKAVSWALWQQS